MKNSGAEYLGLVRFLVMRQAKVEEFASNFGLQNLGGGVFLVGEKG
jgi:hypothetical protein